MRMALLIHELLIEGGGERQIVCLARALAQRGHEVVIFTNAYDRANCFPEICTSLTIRDVGRGLLPSMRKPFFLRGYLDMLHLANSVEAKFDIWNPHHWPAQWSALRLKNRLGGKVVWMSNDVPDFLQKTLHPGSTREVVLAPLHFLYFLYDRKQNRGVDLTVLLSNWAVRQFQAAYKGATTIVQSGMDPARFNPGGDGAKIRARFGCAEDEFLLLWLGIFMPHRRLEDAIQAVGLLVARGARVRLLLAGSDRSFPGYVSDLKSLASKLGVGDEISFAGKVAEDEIRDFYAAGDAFLFPNENQTWGLSVLEAMACGCLALVSKGAAVHEALTDLENAVLFAARNPEDLSDKIDKLRNHPELRSAIANRGMQMVRQKYDWNSYAKQVERICQDGLRADAPLSEAASVHSPTAQDA